MDSDAGEAADDAAHGQSPVVLVVAERHRGPGVPALFVVGSVGRPVRYQGAVCPHRVHRHVLGGHFCKRRVEEARLNILTPI